MLPCSGCAYRASIPGNCHIQCKFDWAEMPDEIPVGNQHGVRMGWFMFPFNFDPTWGPNECPARSETRDDSKLAKDNPIAELISLLG